MKAAAGTLDGILDTVSAKHDVMPLLDLLGVSGKLVRDRAPASRAGGLPQRSAACAASAARRHVVAHERAGVTRALPAPRAQVMLGVPPEMLAFHAAALVMQQKVLTGSLIGGTPITQQMLNFCGEKNVMADIEVIKMQDVNTAFDRMLKSDVRCACPARQGGCRRPWLSSSSGAHARSPPAAGTASSSTWRR